MFEGYIDVMNFGPRAIGLDFSFVNKHLFGLPEHAADFRLQDTLFTENFTDPYRLYNVDVFPYKLNST